jgi:hypothetical protein
MLALLTYYVSVVKQTSHELRKMISVIKCRSIVACPAIGKETQHSAKGGQKFLVLVY